MPRFAPFPGVRYDTARVDLADVTAPPYDVIDADERAALAARSPFNAVHVDSPVPEPGVDCYEEAAARFLDWQHGGVLVTDEPSLYIYRMSFADEHGRARQTTGVIGALGLEPPGDGDVLPHEHTTPKAKSDRLDLLRATAANLSPIWCLSLADGLSKLCDPAAATAIGRWHDLDGVEHSLWRLADPDAIAAITDTVASAPVVIADGHHRYETSLTYLHERAARGAVGTADATMTFVVELADEQLTVQAIHRLVSGLPDGFDTLAALEPWFEPVTAEAPDVSLLDRMEEAGALALVLPGAAWLLHPRSARGGDVDAVRAAEALASFPPHELRYQHGVGTVLDAVRDGRAEAAILLRPVSVAQIADTAHARDRFPPKTTFFWPKARTGLVFRPLDRPFSTQ